MLGHLSHAAPCRREFVTGGSEGRLRKNKYVLYIEAGFSSDKGAPDQSELPSNRGCHTPSVLET